MRTTLAAAALAALLGSGAAHAIDGASFEAGSGDDTDMWRAGVQVDWGKRLFESGAWHLGAYWDFQVGQWRGHSSAGGNRTITDLGLTPVFRLQHNSRTGLYLEAAIGFHLISPTRINSSRAFGSSFQFGDHIGVGYRFGQKQAFDLSLRLQHLSNGGIKKPNPGINFAQLRLQYHFD